MKPAHQGLILGHLIILWVFLWGGKTADAAMNVVDMSHIFDNETIYWVSAKSLTMNVTANGTSPDGDYWYQSEEISAATHGGTHLDAPCHFARGRWCVSDIPLARLIAPAAVVDISSHVRDDPSVHLTTEHLLEWEKVHGRIPDRGLLLVRTGWSRFWPDRLRYTGTATRDVRQLRFPSIRGEVAEWLAANRDVVGIGVDSMSVDVPNGDRKVHTTLYARNIYGLENLDNLEMLPPTGAVVYAMPMKLGGASGAPCRVFAQLPGDVSAGVGLTGRGLAWISAAAVVGFLYLRR